MAQIIIQIPTFFSPYISQVVQFNILIFYMVRFFTETKSPKQESASGSDDDAPLSSYRQLGSNNRAPPPPGPIEAEYLARYLSHRNKQLKVDTNTDNTEQHSKVKVTTTKTSQVQRKLMPSSMQLHYCSSLMPRREKEKYY